MRKLHLLPALAAAFCLAFATSGAHSDETGATTGATGGSAYEARSTGTRTLVAGPVAIKILLDSSNLGDGAVEVGELILPPEAGQTPAHPHGSLEIFYVVEGVLGHEVNGKAYRLEPGDLGFVKAGDMVKHAALTDVPVKAVVIWVAGGESDRLIKHAGFSVATE